MILLHRTGGRGYALPLNLSGNGAYLMFLTAQEPIKITYFGRWTAKKSLLYIIKNFISHA